jgi:hypothetical protein
MKDFVVPSDVLAPLLWVIPNDHLLLPAPQVQVAAERLGFEAWQLHEGSALAISVYSPCRGHGRPLDYPAFLRRRAQLKPLDVYFCKCMSVENAELPDQRFWPRIWLSAAEEDSPRTITMRSNVISCGHIIARFHRRKACTEAVRSKLMQVLGTWFTAATAGINGEALQPQVVQLHPFSADTGSSAQKFGFDLPLAYPEAVSWPWLELYLRLRAELPDRDRFSVQFIQC